MLGLHLDVVKSSIQREPFISLLVIFAIALGMGVFITISTVHHNLNKLPLTDKNDNIYRVLLDNWSPDVPYQEPNEPPVALTYRDATELVKSDIPVRQAIMFQTTLNVKVGDSRKPLTTTTRVTQRDFFDMFDAPFAHGGYWGESDDGARPKAVVVIGDAMNRRLFGGGNNVGKTIKVQDTDFTIIGILQPWDMTPRFYDLTQAYAPVEQLFMPFGFFNVMKLSPYLVQNYDINVIKDAGGDFNRIFFNSETIFAQLWVEFSDPSDTGRYQSFIDAYVTSEQKLGRFPRPLNNRLFNISDWVDRQQEQAEKPVKAFMVVAFLFLLICMFNVVSLLLSKFFSRAREVSIQRAIGATKGDIMTQHLLEVILMGILAGILGLFFARLGLNYMQSLYEATISVDTLGAVSTGYSELDVNMIVKSVIYTLLSIVLAALYPAWQISRIPPARYLR